MTFVYRDVNTLWCQLKSYDKNHFKLLNYLILMITMIHGNPIAVKNGILQVDRKFLTGMRRYVEELNVSITSIHPELNSGEVIMDMVEIPLDEIGFSVIPINRFSARGDIANTIINQLSRTKLVYGGGNWGCLKLAKKLNIPYIMVLEYDFKTQLIINCLNAKSQLRKIVRRAKTYFYYKFIETPLIKQAKALQCNGYPVYLEAKNLNKNALLYLDSRIEPSILVSNEALERRFSAKKNRRLRLLFSGRYEQLKGADHCVMVAIECLRQNIDIELHCYGQGSLRDEMRKMSSESNYSEFIYIHDAVSYPELMQLAVTFDLFVCCHIQNDPSCTYIESFGAGLPIVGYANKMWWNLNHESQVGFATPVGKPLKVVESIKYLIDNSVALQAMSFKARDFALQHTFDIEFNLRTKHILEILKPIELRQS